MNILGMKELGVNPYRRRDGMPTTEARRICRQGVFISLPRARRIKRTLTGRASALVTVLGPPVRGAEELISFGIVVTFSGKVQKYGDIQERRLQRRAGELY